MTPTPAAMERQAAIRVELDELEDAQDGEWDDDRQCEIADLTSELKEIHRTGDVCSN